MKLNRGQWSEIYLIFYFIDKKYLECVDFDLNILKNQKYKINSIIINNDNHDIKFNLYDFFVEVEKNSKIHCILNYQETTIMRDIIHKNIITKNNEGQFFEIADFNKWNAEKNIFKDKWITYKNKSDICLNVTDLKTMDKKTLNYSVKSFLGGRSSLFNASINTMFKYQIYNFNDQKMNDVNNFRNVNSLARTLTLIRKFRGFIIFEKISSKIFEDNLKKIHKYLPKFLSMMLVESQIYNLKELREIIHFICQKYKFEFNLKYFFDFIYCLNFNFLTKQSIEDDQEFGGVILIYPNQKIYLLDVSYNKYDLISFMVRNTSLDVPSSKKFEIGRIYKENENYYINLFLKIRFKR
ncbi:HpaII family restriction endonuclease [Mycoplasmopsis ciconiae]|uniref:HpaII family restriction endonuclease n=1 Tax=Mycoplasmopsis ciconiae TaxID=561067 RepID=A0ABU7MLF6_9BACT|nr:HpaII family restriction endonuclease [Mycoplasmopsis ciconiae]